MLFKFLKKIIAKKYSYQVSRIDKSDSIVDIYLYPLEEPLFFMPGDSVFLSFRDNQKVSKKYQKFVISSSPEKDYLKVSIPKKLAKSIKIGKVKVQDTVVLYRSPSNFLKPAFSFKNQNKNINLICCDAGLINFNSFLEYFSTKDLKSNTKLILINSHSQTLSRDYLKNIKIPKKLEVQKISLKSLKDFDNKNNKENLFFISCNKEEEMQILSQLENVYANKKNIFSPS